MGVASRCRGVNVRYSSMDFLSYVVNSVKYSAVWVSVPAVEVRTYLQWHEALGATHRHQVREVGIPSPHWD